MDKIVFFATCPICFEKHLFSAPEDYYTWRNELYSVECISKQWPCITRERAMAKALFSLVSQEQVKKMAIHESSPMPRGLALWLQENCTQYTPSGYYPGSPRGGSENGYRNEDLENQTFDDGVFDLVLHSDVLEHLFNPFSALREIWRTLKAGGYCIFTAPTYPGRVSSEQVAFRDGDGVRIVGEPEYHGNPQSGDGSLVTWRYGYDLPDLIAKETEFDVEVRRWNSKKSAVMGPMTEVYILYKD